MKCFQKGIEFAFVQHVNLLRCTSVAAESLLELFEQLGCIFFWIIPGAQCARHIACQSVALWLVGE